MKMTNIVSESDLTDAAREPNASGTKLVMDCGSGPPEVRWHCVETGRSCM